MLNYYYKNSIENFSNQSNSEIIGIITLANQFDLAKTQNKSWEEQIIILKDALRGLPGELFFEFSIPRMGKRIDCLLIIQSLVFIIEFKVGEKHYHRENIEQVWDYALDLKNFHKPSHQILVVPILCSTKAKNVPFEIVSTSHNDKLINPLKTNSEGLRNTVIQTLDFFKETDQINVEEYITGSYSPTPTIIEAAVALYNNHNVDSITRSDADAKNLTITTNYVANTIDYAKRENKKIICFVTGVPGAGKTLVGLKIATEHLDKGNGETSVFLSGNKPLVDILQEALTRDRVLQERLRGKKITKKDAKKSVKAFIQIIHHYRDEYLRDPKAPYDHVAIFDEAQRAWTKKQTVDFMKRKKGIPDFNHSEPEFLISCLDRHQDWAVIVCLVGGGQEINTGEAGISEWIDAIKTSFPNWQTRISPNLFDTEYNAIETIKSLENNHEVLYNPDLHLAVSMRSYRAENVSNLVKQILDIDHNAAKTLQDLKEKYPIVLTRDLNKAKDWLKEKARGSERYGIVVSSEAYRLKPLAIDVRPELNHVSWFLDDKDDVRSSFFLEDAATQFQVQGLELDWTCVTWDADLRFSQQDWKTYSFKGNKWQNINKEIRKKYLVNAYRVLLTRARQGMVIVIPYGCENDHSRKPEFYDSTFEYLKEIGFDILNT